MYARVKPEGSLKYINVWATHLDHSDHYSGKQRSEEAKVLINEAKKTESGIQDPEPILIIGDFNQQREKDYMEEEWSAICANKYRRASPTDDGVDKQLSQAGYSCIWDERPRRANWKVAHPPPSTHWTGTIVDYTYYKGSIQCDGCFVSSSGLSDHRLIVSEWIINEG